MEKGEREREILNKRRESRDKRELEREREREKRCEKTGRKYTGPEARDSVRRCLDVVLGFYEAGSVW